MTAMPTEKTSAAERLAVVQDRIRSACERVDRPSSSVVLVAVSKTHPPEAVRAMLAAGVTEFGENRVRELLAKRDVVPEARWHLIGRLQSKKAKLIADRQILVHSMDRRSLADALSRRAGAAGAVQRVLVQVNVGDDPAKGGCPVNETLDLVAYARTLPNLAVEGLMTMPPMPPDDVGVEATRPLFAELRRLRDEARTQWPEVTHLSMGMSDDLEVAIEEGATLVRVGTALFGPRKSAPWQPIGGSR
jgi:PLP dependent protein